MLKSLLIRNYALIDELEMKLSRGLTIISGETGAGKSIILGALDLITGKRADTSVLLDKQKKCVVEAVFDIRSYALNNFFEEQNLDFEELTTIRREINPGGKSRAFINDTPVNLDVLQKLGNKLIDIDSQHQNILLGSNVFQLQVFDAFARHNFLLEEYREAYAEYIRLKQKHAGLLDLSHKAKADLDYYQFQYDELEKAMLTADEQEALEKETEILSHVEEIKNALFTAWNILQEEESSVVRKLKKTLTVLQRIHPYYADVAEYEERLESAYLDLKDLSGELEIRGNDIEYDPVRMEQLRDRLNLIYHLEDKHQVKTVEELIKLKDQLEQRIIRIGSYDREITETERLLSQTQQKVWELGGKLSANRKAVLRDIEKEVVALLHELGIPVARFQILFTENAEPGPSGFDHVEFLFSANVQSPSLEIGKVASGGELSRLMLSLKSLLTQSVGLPTIIFDEIDTGVSGDIADRVGQIIARMGRHMQVINITHLPQIASKGQNHYLVYKKDSDGKTHIRVKLLSPEERITEIAKLLSGRELSEAAYQNARELLKNAMKN